MPIYLNAASHGLPDPAVTQRMRSHLALEAEIGPTAAAARVAEEGSAIREAAAGLIGADAADTGFASTTFGAWLAIAARLGLAGRRVLVAPHEWGENIAALSHLAGSVEALPKLDFQSPDLAPWQRRIDEDVAAIFLPLVTSISGHRYPAEAIARMPRPDGCKLILDAAQGLGQMPVDVRALGADAMVATCRKWLRGPRGTAIYWLAPGQERLTVAQTEPFDANLTLRLGLGAAIEAARGETVPAIRDRISELTGLAYAQARALGLETLTGDPPQTGALTLRIAKPTAQRLKAALETAEIWVKWPDPSVDEPLANDLGAGSVALRIAPHVYNSAEDLEIAFSVIRGTLT